MEIIGCRRNIRQWTDMITNAISHRCQEEEEEDKSIMTLKSARSDDRQLPFYVLSSQHVVELLYF